MFFEISPEFLVVLVLCKVLNLRVKEFQFFMLNHFLKIFFAEW